MVFHVSQHMLGCVTFRSSGVYYFTKGIVMMSDYTKEVLITFIGNAFQKDGPIAIVILKKLNEQKPGSCLKHMLQSARKDGIEEEFYDDLRERFDECQAFYTMLLDNAVVIDVGNEDEIGIVISMGPDDSGEDTTYLHN